MYRGANLQDGVRMSKCCCNASVRVMGLGVGGDSEGTSKWVD